MKHFLWKFHWVFFKSKINWKFSLFIFSISIKKTFLLNYNFISEKSYFAYPLPSSSLWKIKNSSFQFPPCKALFSKWNGKEKIFFRLSLNESQIISIKRIHFLLLLFLGLENIFVNLFVSFCDESEDFKWNMALDIL